MAPVNGSNPRSIPDDKVQVNFNLKKESFSKLKSVAFTEGVTNADLFNRAVDRFIEDYEKKNGKIKVKRKAGGLEGL